MLGMNAVIVQAEEHPRPVEDGGAIPTSPLQFYVGEIDRYTARDLNAKWHSRLPFYKTGFCLNAKVAYGLFYKNLVYGVAIWSNPVARNLPQKEYLELRRMALSPQCPKNTASRMLSVMTRLIKKKYPEITRLVSYQDVEVHTGCIYRASGWRIGLVHRGGSWNRPNSKNLSNGKPRTRPDSNRATGPKVRWELTVR